ncbi:MAG: fumarylacetoacetate hydrolase family protein [Bryobacterales bacterium]|nr:fumarylacetoacetate hydrolase family protein [Bryobacterales bacterium]
MPKRIRFSLNPNIEPTVPDSSNEVKYGIVDNGMIVETPSFDSTEKGSSHPMASVRLLPPCWPSKIVCVGRNYPEHARELGNEPPAEPMIFLKPPSSLIADGDRIVYPRISGRVDYEGELGAVISRRARQVRREEAFGYIFGYTCVNDITARDLQKKDGQWTRGKGFDTFCAVGPWVVPASEVRLDELRVQTYVDGVKKQDAPIAEMMFPVDAIVAFVTEFMTLEPGDLIATGTPPGVGAMQPGSVVRVEIPGLGAIENLVVKG